MVIGLNGSLQQMKLVSHLVAAMCGGLQNIETAVIHCQNGEENNATQTLDSQNIHMTSVPQVSKQQN